MTTTGAFDHLHVLVGLEPTTVVAEVAKMLKGTSSGLNPPSGFPESNSRPFQRMAVGMAAICSLDVNVGDCFVG